MFDYKGHIVHDKYKLVVVCNIHVHVNVHVYIIPTTIILYSYDFVFVAFTELQTDLELVYHPSEGTLPFLEFRSFAMRFLFPRDQNHVVLRPLEVCVEF